MRSGIIEVPWNNGVAFVGWVSVQGREPAATSGATGEAPTTEEPTGSKSPRSPQGFRALRRPAVGVGGTERAERAVQALRIRLQSWGGVA